MSQRVQSLSLESLITAADEPNRIITVNASAGKSGKDVVIKYTSTKVVGNGSFGVVFAAKTLRELILPCNVRRIAHARHSGERRVWGRHRGTGDSNQEGLAGQAVQGGIRASSSTCPADPGSAKNRELQIMRLVGHPNVVDLKAYFYSNGDKVGRSIKSTHCHAEQLAPQKDEVFLNLVLEYVPETVFKASKHYSKLKQQMPWLQIKLYMYQVGDLALSPVPSPCDLPTSVKSSYIPSIGYLTDLDPAGPSLSRLHSFRWDMPS